MITNTVMARANPIWNASRLKFFKHEAISNDKNGWLHFENATSKEVFIEALRTFDKAERRLDKNKLATYRSLLLLPNFMITGCAFKDIAEITELAESDEKPKVRVQTYFGTYERPPLSIAAYAVPAIGFAESLKNVGFDVGIDLLFMKGVTLGVNPNFSIKKVDNGINLTIDFLREIFAKHNIHCATDAESFGTIKSISEKQIEDILNTIKQKPELVTLFTDIEKGSDFTTTVKDMHLHYLYQDGMHPNIESNTDPNSVYIHVGAEQGKLFYARRQVFKELESENTPNKKTIEYISNFGRAPYLATLDGPEVYLDEYLDNRKLYDDKLKKAVELKNKGMKSEYRIPTIKGYEMLMKHSEKIL